MKQTSPGREPGRDMNQSGKELTGLVCRVTPTSAFCQWAFCWLSGRLGDADDLDAVLLIQRLHRGFCGAPFKIVEIQFCSHWV